MNSNQTATAAFRAAGLDRIDAIEHSRQHFKPTTHQLYSYAPNGALVPGKVTFISTPRRSGPSVYDYFLDVLRQQAVRQVVHTQDLAEIEKRLGWAESGSLETSEADAVEYVPAKPQPTPGEKAMDSLVKAVLAATPALPLAESKELPRCRVTYEPEGDSNRKFGAPYIVRLRSTNGYMSCHKTREAAETRAEWTDKALRREYPTPISSQRTTTGRQVMPFVPDLQQIPRAADTPAKRLADSLKASRHARDFGILQPKFRVEYRTGLHAPSGDGWYTVRCATGQSFDGPFTRATTAVLAANIREEADGEGPAADHRIRSMLFAKENV